MTYDAKNKKPLSLLSRACVADALDNSLLHEAMVVLMLVDIMGLSTNVKSPKVCRETFIKTEGFAVKLVLSLPEGGEHSKPMTFCINDVHAGPVEWYYGDTKLANSQHEAKRKLLHDLAFVYTEFFGVKLF